MPTVCPLPSRFMLFLELGTWPKWRRPRKSARLSKPFYTPAVSRLKNTNSKLGLAYPAYLSELFRRKFIAIRDAKRIRDRQGPRDGASSTCVELTPDLVKHYVGWRPSYSLSPRAILIRPARKAGRQYRGQSCAGCP